MKKDIFLKAFIPLILTGVFPVVVFVALMYNKMSLASYLVLVVVITFIFLFGFVISKQLVSPIEKVIKGVEKTEKGELNVKLNIEPGDRFTQLIDSFNRMAEQVKEGRYLSEETKEVIEKEVKKKTRELDKKTDFLRKQFQDKQKQLQDKEEELNKFRDATVKREIEMMKLKKKIKQLTGETSEEEQKNQKQNE